MTQASRTVTTTTTSGQTVTASLGLFNLRLVPQGGGAVTALGFCDDPLVGIGVGKTYNMAMQDASEAPELAGPSYRAAAYLVRTAEARIAAAADPRLESGAHQIAVWQLGGRVRIDTPTNDAAMNARAAALRTEALATADRTPGTATSAATACAGTGVVTVTVSGAAGAKAQVSVSSGSATVSANQVILGANGQATVRVTASAPGASVVRVVLDTAALRRAVRVGTSGPQQTVSVTPGSTAFQVPGAFTDCTSAPSIPGGGDATPSTPNPLAPSGERPTGETPQGGGGTPAPTPQRPGITLIKTAPARARLGAAITYRLTVKNTGDTTLTAVAITDPVPDGLVVPSGSPASRLRRGGAIGITVGRLAPGASRTYSVRLRSLKDRTGRICNLATATGTNGSGSSATVLRARARACTTLFGRPRDVVPAVTA
ncbi:MAG: DUF11 domain-containing protein [Thermoleophilia bacterium]|nr:DUF11 domain-containing protein [Thermoleophilia bacterium]